MRVSEIYLSVQGEGPRVGSPTVFVRFGGCNLRCPLWPCDTQHAIDPKYRNEWQQMVPERVFEEIERTASGQQWYNVCFTGGEPFLQPDHELDQLINLLVHDGQGVMNVECFSNGTLPYTALAREQICFIMDWKLPGSGEADTGTEERISNFGGLSWKDAVKFTIADRDDYEQAKRVYYAYKDVNDMPTWFYGVVWGKLDNAELVKWVLEDGLPWRHNMQVHNMIWDRTQRGI
jgi:7-carboxy-7-deazaguanine synthase